MKQKFKGEVLTTTKTVNKILKMYNQAQVKEGLNWYNDANRFANKIACAYLSSDYMTNRKMSINKVVGVIAALSPLKSWTENKRITITFLREGKSNHTKTMTAKAQEILNSDGELDTICDILNGSKIVNFFMNIVDPKSGGVTIDRHAVSLAVGKDLQGGALQMSTNQYQFFVNAYKIAASKVGLLPSQLQAVTWVEWRKHKKTI